MRAVSKKRRALLPERAAVREAVLERDDYRCQFWISYAEAATATEFDAPLACGGPLDVHEVIPRSADPTAWLRPEACVTLCRRHHDWVGDHPAFAHEIGLHGFSWERE